jgi:prepilin-type processing-associated H-X9-DG protein
LLFEVTGNGSATGAAYNIAGAPYAVNASGTVPSDEYYASAGASTPDGYSPAGRGMGYAAYELNGYNATAGTGGLQYATGYLLQSKATAIYGTVTAFNSPLGRHSDGAVYLLADGHAKWLKGSMVSSGGYNNNSGAVCGATDYSSYFLAAQTSCATPSLAATFSPN